MEAAVGEDGAGAGAGAGGDGRARALNPALLNIQFHIDVLHFYLFHDPALRLAPDEDLVVQQELVVLQHALQSGVGPLHRPHEPAQLSPALPGLPVHVLRHVDTRAPQQSGRPQNVLLQTQCQHTDKDEQCFANLVLVAVEGGDHRSAAEDLRAGEEAADPAYRHLPPEPQRRPGHLPLTTQPAVL